MTKQEYAEFEESVAAFFEREGINNLSTGHYKCPDCDVKFNDDGECPECNGSRDAFNEPYFSWSPCDCCGQDLGGNREYATGVCIGEKEDTGIREYSICEDCAYYAVYGQLGDLLMWDIEHDQS